MQECYMLFWTNSESNIPQKKQLYGTYLPSHKPSKLDKQDILGSAGKVRKNSYVMFPPWILHMDVPRLANQQGFAYISSVPILDEV